jgi:arylsulfatase
MTRPNFLIIVTDQWHPRCLGYAGHPVVRTPNLDRLAADGAVCNRMYTPQPLCMPARASMFTGLTPRGHGVRMNGIPLDPSIPTFTEALRRNGYATHCAGKLHLLPSQPPKGTDGDPADPLQAECRKLWHDGRLSDLPMPFYGLESADYVNGHGHGSYGHYIQWLDREHPEQAHLFHEAVAVEPPGPARNLFNRQYYKWALPAELHPTHWVADRTIDYLQDHNGERPFCLMCSIQDPHSPFAAPEPYCRRYNPADVPPAVGRDGEHDDLPPHFRRMRETAVKTSGNQLEPMAATDLYRADCAAQYYGLIEFVDAEIGRVLDTLDAQGLAEDTVVIFLADHGEALGDHGMWGKGPYHFDSVIRVPFVARWPGHIAPGTRHTQPASLLDLAPTVLDLADVPLPLGATPPEPEAPAAPSPWPGRSLRGALTGAGDDSPQSVVVEMDEDYLGFKMRTLVTDRYRLTCYSEQTYGELFDLQEDPDELHNRWDDPAMRSVRDNLRLQLLDRLMTTDISLPRQLSRS